MEKHKSCSFFGHRKIILNDKLKLLIKENVEDLIVNHKVENFFFGSKSEFNDLCHLIVTELKAKYPNIKRINYTCKSESCTLDTNIEELEKKYFQVLKKEIKLQGYEKEIEFKTKYLAGKASYIERNQAMIDDSDFCVFYYNESYIPTNKTNSGTKIAYKYALKRNKKILNLFY